MCNVTNKNRHFELFCEWDDLIKPGGFSGQALFAAWEANACGALAVALWPDADRNAVALVVGESRDGEDGVLGAGGGLV